MSHRWKMTVMALDSITHRYCLVFREQSVAFCRGTGRETSDGILSYPVLSISGENPVIFSEVSTEHVLCYLFRPWCDVETVGSGGAADCVSSRAGGGGGSSGCHERIATTDNTQQWFSAWGSRPTQGAT